ncbi:MAG: response regulator [Rhizobacter sp.]|nr:response regulator [Ferruginibacter sp.]
MQTVNTADIYTCDILLIDDDIDEHFLFECLLDDIGLNKRLLAFDSGKKAIQYLNTLSRDDLPSLIVLDYFMSVMSGKHLLLYINSMSRFSRIPVIVHSSQMGEDIKIDLMKSGAIECFKKTPDMKELKMFLALSNNLK